MFRAAIILLILAAGSFCRYSSHPTVPEKTERTTPFVNTKSRATASATTAWSEAKGKRSR